MGSSFRRTVVRTSLVGAVIATVMGTYLAVPASATPSAPAQQCGANTSVAPTLTPSRTTIGQNETATVTVTGSNYLVPPHVCGSSVFGGVYVAFGWVKPGGQWGPSWRTSTTAAGLFGQTYSYPGEGGGAETRDDGTGTVRLISFTAGGESGDATPFHMDGSGNWSADLIVRGSKFSFVDVVTGQAATVDCMVVQCGVLTWGAHGKSSRTNEQFSPINFTNPQGQIVAPTAPGGAGGSGNPPATGPIAGAPAADGGGNDGTPAANGSSGGGATPASGEGQPAEVGSVGEAPPETDAEVAGDSAEADEVEETEEIAAKVQDFGDSGSGGGGGSAGLIVGGIVAVLAVLGGVALFARRRAGAA